MDNGASSYRRFRDNGDECGLDEIIMDYSDGLMLYLTSIVGNIQTAEELAEDTFVLIGTKKPKFKGKSSFKTWLCTIGRNIAIDYLRKNSKHINVSIDDAPELISEEDAVEAAYIRKEQQIIGHKAMRKLKPEYQQVLWLIYFEELSNKETAKIIKKSVHSIESILYRARKSLKSQLEMECFDYEKT
ncbi:MAG: sigma-70 family RNA polymerase sigma factor [Ruminococcus sp.]|nr:sigma-70 family RNA polymerase sigma factor [Ruminococcus sp.]